MTDAVNAEIDLSSFMPGRSGPPCTVKVALDELAPEQREIIDAAFAHPYTSKKKVGERLVEWSGIRISSSTLGRHTRGECACGK